MIGRMYRLIDTKRIEMKQREIQLSDNTILVRPEFMSICAADQRYYLGQRGKEILAKKLPMALIHEATGTVIRDMSGQFRTGDKVVLIPLEEADMDNRLNEIKGNYRESSKFASSDSDGFIRDIIAITPDRILPVGDGYSQIYVFSEILSVALSAINAFEISRQTSAASIGVWGDGSMGLITALALRCKYPQSHIYVFGKSVRKLSKFPFVTKKYYIDNIPGDLTVNHAFECVGGDKSGAAIKQITDKISPQGVVSLLGVSENTVAIDTRQVLNKGLKLIGNSRSDRKDFEEAVRLINDDAMCQKYLKLLVSQTIEIRNEDDISRWFEQDVLNDFKTVGVWKI